MMLMSSVDILSKCTVFYAELLVPDLMPCIMF